MVCPALEQFLCAPMGDVHCIIYIHVLCLMQTTRTPDCLAADVARKNTVTDNLVKIKFDTEHIHKFMIKNLNYYRVFTAVRKFSAHEKLH